MFVDSVYFCLLRWWWWTEHDERNWHLAECVATMTHCLAISFCFLKSSRLSHFTIALRNVIPDISQTNCFGDVSVMWSPTHRCYRRQGNQQQLTSRARRCVEKHIGVLGGGLESPVKCMHDHFVIQKTWSGVLVMSHATFFVDSTFRPYGLKSILFYLLSTPHLPHT